MDIVEASSELQDWEVLHSDSDSESVPLKLDGTVNAFDEIDSGGLIQVNYFSLDQQNRRELEEFDDDRSAESDNPSWIDPGVEENPIRYFSKDAGELWSDSGSERSEDRKLSEFEGGNELGFDENQNIEVSLNGIGETGVEKEGNMEDLGETEVGAVKFNDLVEDSELGVEGTANSHLELEVLGKGEGENEMIGSEGEVCDENGNKNSGEIQKSGLVWWKMPMDLVKYCVLRMSPVWTVSVAAAVMGFVILGRRLYKMKKKTRGLGIKVTVDDKKVSQVMSRAARLNEAFSVVKLVPVIRPSLPGAGMATWPAMSLR